MKGYPMKQTTLFKVTTGWRLARFFGYAKFADGQEFEGNGSDCLVDLATAYDNGNNELLTISVYGPHDSEANWAFADYDDVGVNIDLMACHSVEEARKLLRDCFPE
jgi:hypothetical protein